MDYVIDRPQLYSLIDQEVSRVANETYADDGTSLYDNIIVTSNDRTAIERLENDAIDSFVKRTFDICTPVYDNGETESGLAFDVPGFDAAMGPATEREITRYIVFSTCAGWFRSRCVSRVEEFSALAKEAMDKAVTFLKSIKAPERNENNN